MATMDLGAGKGGRKNVDTEINLVPMIDLLVVTIAFLLLTQALSSLGRLDATAQAPGAGCGTPSVVRKLVVDARREATFVLTWKDGDSVVRTLEVPKRAEVVREGKVTRIAYPELAKVLAEEHGTHGLHKDAGDTRLDPLVLRTANDLPYAALVGMLDASASVRRAPRHPGEPSPLAFDVSFALD